MVGRSVMLERLRGAVDAAEYGTTDLPTVALVAGEAGIGKTRLLRETVAALPPDVIVLSALAEPGSMSKPFDVARQLSTGPLANGTGAAGTGDRPAEAAVSAVASAVAKGRVVLVVEDLHWIDADSVSVLDQIARQPWPNLVLLATYRPSDLRRGAPGGDLVLRLERRNEVEQIRLDRLDRNEVAAMMAAISGGNVSSAAVEAVHRRSGGVPFVIEELLRCAGPGACSDDIVDAELPWSLEEAVRQQLADLDPGERTIVDALGVYGAPISFEDLVELTQLAEPDLLAHLRGLVTRGVLEESRDDRLWFGHALLADAVPHQLLGRERRRLHERCFALLERRAERSAAADPAAGASTVDWTALAAHAVGANRFDEVAAIARAGARHYLDHGSTFQALRLACEGLAEEPGDAELLAVATEGAWRLDFLSEAVEHASAWERAARTDQERVDATRFLARMHVELDNPSDCEAALQRLESLSETAANPADRARAQGAVAQILMLRHDARAREWAELAIEGARAAGDRWAEVQARAEWASTYVPVPRAERLRALLDVAEAARQLGDGVLLSRTLNNTLELVPANSHLGRRMANELRRVAARNGLDKLGHLNLLWWDSFTAFAEGDLAAHRRLMQDWAGWTLSPDVRRSKAVGMAELALEEGRVADARALLVGVPGALHVDGTPVIPSSGTSPNLGIAAGCACSADMDHKPVGPRLGLVLASLERDAAAGRHAFELLADQPVGYDSWFLLGDSIDVVLQATALGVPGDELRRRFVEGSFAGHPMHDEVVEATAGLLALASGDAVAAADLIGDYLTRVGRHVTATQAGAPDGSDLDGFLISRPIEGSLHLAHAQALLAAGRRDEASAAVRRALDALERWPGWRRDRADALLARIEGSTARSQGELTARESEVAALIAEGLTNGQLAERLFISPKTAAVHVSNILAKLSLSSRAEIAAWAVRHDLPIAG